MEGNRFARKEGTEAGKGFALEFFLALVICSVASLAAMSNLALAPPPLLSATVDGPGHLTKVVYLAEHLQRLEFPSWCPFWYNGSTMVQYYAPLSYFIMVAIQLVTGSVQLTAKWFGFLSLSLGSLGVWALYRRFVGPWWGLFAVPIYCLQSIICSNSFREGAYAQGAIYLLTPWLLYFVVAFLLKPKPVHFLGTALLTALLILSHAMHAFMIGLMIALTLLPYLMRGKAAFRSYILLGFAMATAALLCGFWWLIGITSLETPGVPYLLEEATISYSATLRWFFPWRQAILSFNVTTLLVIPVAALFYWMIYRKKPVWDDRRFLFSWMIGLSAFCVLFSFGQNFQPFRYFPFIETLVPGRILSLAAISSAILFALIIQILWESRKKLTTPVSVVWMIFLSLAALWEMNPLLYHYDAEDVSPRYASLMPLLPGEGEFFERGRYTWVSPINSVETFYASVVYRLNTSEGWNIEGTPHNRAIWSYNIALMSHNEDYIVRNLFYWNVRSVLVASRYEGLMSSLEEKNYDFLIDSNQRAQSNSYLYTSDQPSSYYLTDPRNTLVVGPGALFISHEYPSMVSEYETDLLRYPMEDLLRYRILYIIEPDVSTSSKAAAFEERVEELVGAGIHVIIEPSALQRHALFGVTLNTIEGTSLGTGLWRLRQEEGLDNDVSLWAGRQLFSLEGLDEVSHSFFAENATVGLPAIGTKKVGRGEITFIGGRLSQYLASPSVAIWGEKEEAIIPDVATLKSIITEQICKGDFEEDYRPGAFPVLTSQWDYRGGTFSYQSDAPEEILVSVTYTPRWRVTLEDGSRLEAKSRENLIVLNLPAGHHTVHLHYGISKYGMAGYAITALGFLLLILSTVFFRRLSQGVDTALQAAAVWLQLPSSDGKETKEHRESSPIDDRPWREEGDHDR